MESSLSPSTAEDILTLAYYRLHDRKFREFHELLEALSRFDTLSNESFLILLWIMRYGNQQKNNSPETAACILHAAELFIRARKRIDPSAKFFPEIKENLNGKLSYYLSTKSHIDKALALLPFEDVEPTIVPPLRFNPIRVQHSYSLVQRFFWSDFRQAYQPKLPHSSEPMDRTEKRFLPVYEAIRLEAFPLSSIETELLIQYALQDDSNSYLELALLCVAAKKQGITLPKLPSHQGSSETEVQDLLDQTNDFKKALERAFKNVVYESPKSPPFQKIPDHVLQDFIKPQKAPYKASFYPADLSSLSRPSIPLWKKAGLHREEYPLPKINSNSLQPLQKEKDPLYQSCIEAERQRLNIDLVAGKKRLAREKQLTMIGRSYGELSSLMATIKEQMLAAKKTMHTARDQTLHTVNKHLDISGLDRLTKAQCKALEGTYPPLTIGELEHLALWGDQDPRALKRAYKTAPQLKDKNVQEEVWKNLCLYEEQAVTILAYQKALDVCNKLQQAKPSEKETLYTDLAKALETDLSTLAKDSHLSFLQVLIFARISKLIPRSDQMSDVIVLSERPCILQKIMGGGKTSVIAALWAFREARYKNKLPTLFAESSLYSSLGDNLKKGQKSALRQDIFTIDCLRSDLDLPRLQQILSDLNEGLSKNWVLVMRSEMLQTLDLELQRLTTENHWKDDEKRKCLRDILNFFKTHASALGDEIDLLARTDFEVNVPVSTDGKTKLLPPRIDLVREIFLHLTLETRLGLKVGTQGLRSKEELKIIFGDLAQKLLEYEGLALKEAPEDVKSAFCTFLIGEKKDPIPKKLKDYVQKLQSSLLAKDQIASALIPLARHIVSDILPPLFKKSPGLHFGRTKDHSCLGKVVPFTGVDTPSDREFGYHYEALCKQFFTAVVKGVDLPQIATLAADFKRKGKREVALKKCILLNTNAASKFKALTGQELDQADKTEVLEAALQTINKDTKRLLAVEAETALNYVGYYPEYYHSSSQALPNLVNSIRGMTGTPWNHDGYHQNLGKVHRDNGAEGQILYTLLERNGKTKIHALSQASMETLLDQAIKDKGKFPDAILDMGALFKHSSIEKTARQFLESAQKKKGNTKNAVLFFHHKPNETTSDHLAVGKFIGGQWQVEFLENTRKQALIDKGLTIDNCLTFFDQRHCTGTDIPLPFQAHALITASETMELRTWLQTVMRLRQFCSSQTADFALHQSFYTFLGKDKGSLTVYDLADFAVTNQARKKAKSTFLALKQQIDEVFIEHYRTHARKGNVPEGISKAYGPLMRPQVTDDPYEQFFLERILQDPVENIKRYRRQRLTLFQKNLPFFSRGDLNQIKKETADIIKKAQAKKEKLPKKTLTYQSSQGVEVELQQELEIEQEQEQELSQEIQNELQQYHGRVTGHKAEHQQWWNPSRPKQSAAEFIQAIRDKNSAHPTKTLSAPEIFQHVRYEPKRHFDKIFPENILMTAAMQRSYDNFLPIFHKSQKIAESILIVKKDDNYTFVIVSSHEAAFLKKNMPKDNGAWLVNASGHSYIEGYSTADILENFDICKGLTYVNLFAGRATHIEEIPQGTLYLRMWLEKGPGKKEDRIDYLTLRSVDRPALDKCIRLTKKTTFATVLDALDNQQLSSKKMRELSNKRNISLLDSAKIQHVSPKNIPYIQNKWLPTLTDPRLIQAVPKSKVKYLTNKQYQHLTKNQALSLEGSKVRELPQNIIDQLSIQDVIDPLNRHFIHSLGKIQIKWLNDKEIRLSKNEWAALPLIIKQNLSLLLSPEAIQNLEVKDLHHLSTDQLHALTKEQAFGLKGITIQELPQKLIELINVQDLMHPANRHFVYYLSEIQMNWMSDNGIQLSKSDWLKLDLTIRQKLKPLLKGVAKDPGQATQF